MATRQNPYKINIFNQKGVTFSSKLTEDSLPCTLNDIPKDEPAQEVVETFKNAVSSFWTYNTDFFDYPPISFQEEGTSTWDQIIKENIFQPFLPKNRLILRHLMKTFMQEDDVYKMQNPRSTLLSVSDQDSPLMKMSFRITGDQNTADHIVRFLADMKRKMDEKKSQGKKKVPKSEKYISRSLKNCDAMLRKKRRLEDMECARDLLGHKLYELNLSHPEIKKEHDFFGIFELEGEEVTSITNCQPTFVPRRTADQSTLKHLGSLGIPQLKIETSAHMQLQAQSTLQEKKPKQEGPGLKRLFRRKSCCCSVCGGISSMEKHTANLMPVYEDLARRKEMTEEISPNKFEIRKIGEKQRSFKKGRLSREDPLKNSTRHLIKDGSHSVHPEPSPDRRRKSYLFLDSSGLVRRPSGMVEVLSTRNPSAKTPSFSEPLNLIPEQEDSPQKASPSKMNTSPFKITLPTTPVEGNLESPGKFLRSTRRTSTEKLDKIEFKPIDSPARSLHNINNELSLNPTNKQAGQTSAKKKPTLLQIKTKKNDLPSINGFGRKPSLSEKLSSPLNKANNTKKDYLPVGKVGSLGYLSKQDGTEEDIPSSQQSPEVVEQKRTKKVRPGWKSISTCVVTTSPFFNVNDLRTMSPKNLKNKKGRTLSKPIFHNTKEINKVYASSPDKLKMLTLTPRKVQVPMILTVRDRSPEGVGSVKWKGQVKSGEIEEKLKVMSARGVRNHKRLETWC